MTQDASDPLVPGNYYHIFNRGNNGENIFYSAENYRYFLIKYDQYLSDYVDTYCFCLLPNHFHLLVQVKSDEQVLHQASQDFRSVGKYAKMSVNLWVNERFRLFFISYSKALNKQIGRKGSLFQKPFRRKVINQEAYFTRLVSYIHLNATHHGIHKDFRTYPWSSYQRILAEYPSKLRREKIIDWFGGKKEYINFHESSGDEDYELKPLLPG